MSQREAGVQGPPVHVDSGFPHSRPRRRIWFRAHVLREEQADAGCWFHSSAGTSSDGRFDLARPQGTCYFADTALAAARERLGRPGDVVAHDEVEGRVVSSVSFAPGVLADLMHRDAARHGVTRELSTSVPYRLAQQWARTFADAGFEGIRYQPRFSSEPALAIAVFGEAGRPADAPAPRAVIPMADVLRSAGYTVLDRPRLRDLGRVLD